MATRATYLLPAGDISQPICFYIHYTHGDTEFQYTINRQDVLTVRQKKTFDGEWRIVYEGLWYPFLNQYLEGAEHLYAFKCCNFSKHTTIMTIAQAQRWVRAFANNKAQNYYLHENIEAMQAQIDDILLQKTDANAVNSGQFSSANLSAWEERFALFSVELENKIAAWATQNSAKYCCGHHSRAAEKLEEDFGLFFDNLIETWAHGSSLLAGGTLAFDFRKASNTLYVRMVEKYGMKLQEAIKAAKTAYGYDDTECDY